MENILVVGANTRAVACSLKKLGCKVYSADYFGTMDLRSCASKFHSVLDQKPLKSCGRFTERFNPNFIEELALKMLDDVDGIICCAGASPSRFPSNKIIGNTNIDVVEDKYRLFKELEGKFQVPETHLISDMDDAGDIATSDPDKNFILKPRYGAGGYGVRMFNQIPKESTDVDLTREIDVNGLNFTFKMEDNEWIIQEFIQGENISASVLAARSDTRTILTSGQIIGEELLGQMEPFGYCGNIVPYSGNIYIGDNNRGTNSCNKNTKKTANRKDANREVKPRDSRTEDNTKHDPNTGNMKISEIAQKVVAHLSLTGSNGVDFILKNGEVYVIEVNPRLQGTFECAEAALNINMVKAHLEACQGHMMKIPPPRKFAVKMVVHAHQRSQVGNLNFKGVHDRPNQGVIIEKGEPLATVLTSSSTRKETIYSAKKLVQRVYKSLNPKI